MSYFLTLLVILSESTILLSLIFYSLFVLTLFEREILGAACCREIVEPFNARKIFLFTKIQVNNRGVECVSARIISMRLFSCFLFAYWAFSHWIWS